jgi:predicted SnoaL-like aldol condensation-catalyzing enzyme
MQCIRHGGWFGTAICSLALITTGALTVANAGQTQDANRKIVLAFTKAMQEQNLAVAVSYITDGYIQHNPNVPTGKAGYLEFFTPRWKDGPKPSAPTLANPPVLSLAEGDEVVLVFKNTQPDPVDPNKSYDNFSFDAYRLEHGKIAEHWDGGLKRPPAPKPP